MNSKRNLIRLILLLILFLKGVGVFAADATPGTKENIKNTFAQLDQSNNFTDNMAYSDMNVLPVGLKQTIGNQVFTLAISKVIFHPEYAEMTLYGRMQMPNMNLFFAGQGIKLSYGGDIIGDATLMLLDTVSIPINGSTQLVLNGSMNNNTGLGNSNTFVTVGCEGFKELSLDGEVWFSRDLLRPIDGSGKETQGIVKARFPSLVIKDWDDLLLDLSIPNFTIVGLDGFSFNVNHAVFDYSDTQNSMSFPVKYASAFPVPDLWRGVYIKELQVTLPPQFAGKNNQPTSFRANDLIIDNQGISGAFTAKNVLPIEMGNASGWSFSVNDFYLTLEKNKIREAGFGGRIGLPVSDTTTLNYTAIMSANNKYQMLVQTNDNIKFDLFSAEAVITENSYVKLEVDNGKFKPEAVLSGYMNISTGFKSGSKTTELNEITFTNLHLRTAKPYLTVDRMQYNGSTSMMGFPISLSNIALSAPGEQVSLKFDLQLNLDERFLNTSSTLELVASYEASASGSKWKYLRTNVGAFRLNNCSIAGVMSLAGGIEIMEGHPVYGDGFAGDLSLEVLSKLKVNVATIFGRKEIPGQNTNFRYWYVDGSVELPGAGILIMTGLSIKGFGGGVSYQMHREIGGNTPTGCRYIPDINSGIGLKASVLLAIPEKMATGEASFEIELAKNYGIRYIGFNGSVKMMEALPSFGNLAQHVADKYKKLLTIEKDFASANKLGGKSLEDWKQQGNTNEILDNISTKVYEREKSGFTASLGINYDFDHSIFHGQFELFVNVPGGIVQGAGANGSAGNCVLHIEPSKWYLHMGTPTNPIGIQIGIGNAHISTGSYFMAGHELPSMKPVPSKILNVIGEDITPVGRYRIGSSLSEGRGLAFGSNFEMSTGNIEFLLLYARLEAQLGFDIMLVDRGNTRCIGAHNTMGMNGWYASGQAYAYYGGEFGVKVNLWFLKTKIPLLQAQAAALMMAELPNPSWFNGYVAAEVNVLNGLVRGNMKLKISLGEKCQIEGQSDAIGIAAIGDLTPSNGSTEVSVFAAPQVALNMPVNSAFDIETDEGRKTYRINISEFNVYDQGGNVLQGKYMFEGNNNKTNATFRSRDIFPGNQTLKAVVKVRFQERKGNGTSWTDVYSNGKLAEETRTHTFTTGPEPTEIPLENVLYTYPVIEQSNYFPKESTSGYVYLRQGQPNLFKDKSTFLRVTDSDSEKEIATADCRYVSDNKGMRAEFSIPALQTSRNYKIELITVASKELASFSNKSTQQVYKGETSASDDKLTVYNSQAADIIRGDLGKRIISYAISSSRYNLFSDKIAGLNKDMDFSDNHGEESGVLRLGVILKNIAERFDLPELTGTLYTGRIPLIQAQAVLDNNTYYKDKMYPLLYENYPVSGMRVSRDPNLLGVPPIRGISIYANYVDAISNKQFDRSASLSRLPFIYDLSRYYKNDYEDLQSQAVLLFQNRGIDTPLRKKSFIGISSGSYLIRLQYRLPNGDAGTSATFNYQLKL